MRSFSTKSCRTVSTVLFSPNGEDCTKDTRWTSSALMVRMSHPPKIFQASNRSSTSRKVLLNMMINSSLIALKIRTNRTFRQRRSAKLRRINLLRLLPLFNPQPTHPIRQSTVRSARRSLRRVATVEAFVRVRDGVGTAACTLALGGLVVGNVTPRVACAR
jgi:hypothetical protein